MSQDHKQYIPEDPDGMWYDEVNGEEENCMSNDQYMKTYPVRYEGDPDSVAGWPREQDEEEMFMGSDPAPEMGMDEMDGGSALAEIEHGDADREFARRGGLVTDESERARDDYDRRRKEHHEKSGVAAVERNDRWAARKRKAQRARARSEEREEFIEDQLISDRKSQIDALRTAYERAAEAVDAVATNLIDHPGGPYTAATIENMQNASKALGPLGDEIRKWEQHQVDMAMKQEDD